MWGWRWTPKLPLSSNYSRGGGEWSAATPPPPPYKIQIPHPKTPHQKQIKINQKPPPCIFFSFFYLYFTARFYRYSTVDMVVKADNSSLPPHSCGGRCHYSYCLLPARIMPVFGLFSSFETFSWLWVSACFQLLPVQTLHFLLFTPPPQNKKSSTNHTHTAKAMC